MTDKIYLKNPYLRELNARVVKKEYSNSNFYVILNQTIFYPNMSGGQPKDTGTINGVTVTDVYEDGYNIVHVLEDDVDEKVRLCIDWNTRFDHMQQHTGQHILSSAFSTLFNAETIGFHLGKDYVYIDVMLPLISQKERQKIERYANEIIFSNFDIKQYFIGDNSVSKLPLRKQPSVDKNIRIVEIDNIDYSPCGGTHHRSTGEIGLIKIRRWEKYKGNIRVEFVCGHRALVDYSSKCDQINEISSLLSVRDRDSAKAVTRLLNENKTLHKKLKDIKHDTLYFMGRDLMNRSFRYKGVSIISEVFSDRDPKDIKYLTSNMINHLNVIVLFGVLEEDKVEIVLGKSTNLAIDIKKIFDTMIKMINGKGGGTNNMLHGGGSDGDKLYDCIQSGINLIKKQI